MNPLDRLNEIQAQQEALQRESESIRGAANLERVKQAFVSLDDATLYINCLFPNHVRGLLGDNSGQVDEAFGWASYHETLDGMQIEPGIQLVVAADDGTTVVEFCLSDNKAASQFWPTVHRFCAAYHLSLDLTAPRSQADNYRRLAKEKDEIIDRFLTSQ